MRLDAARSHSTARGGVYIRLVNDHQLGAVFTQCVQPVLVINLHSVQAVKRCDVDGAA